MKKHKPVILKNVRELAEKLSVSHVTAISYTKRPDWPFAKRAPWLLADIPKMLQWRADALSRVKDADHSTGAVADLRREKLQEEIKKLRAQVRTAEREFEIVSDKYVSRAEIHADNVHALRITRDFLLYQLPHRLALNVANKDPAEVEAFAGEEIREALNELCGRLSEASGQELKLESSNEKA